MAKYLILIYGEELRWENWSEQEREETMAAHRAFREAAGAAVLGGHELRSTATATTLRAEPGQRPVAADGPFLETKEALGGYYLLEARDLDEAISLAGLLREVGTGYSGVEIRPIEES